MIQAQMYNLRAFDLAKRKGRKNKRIVYCVVKHDGKYYAVSGLKSDSLQLLPGYFDRYFFFWSGDSDVLRDKFEDLTFVNIFDFLRILSELT